MSEVPEDEYDDDYEDDEESAFRELDKADIFQTSEDARIEAILAPVREASRQRDKDSREYVHLVLHALMDLQELDCGQGYAFDLANILVREAMEWLSEGPLAERYLERDQKYGSKHPDAPFSTAMITEVLHSWPIVMPKDLQFQLMVAFMNLQRSTRSVSPMFLPAPSPTNLQLRRDSEERMLQWIDYHVGRGQTDKWGRRQVGTAVGLSEDSVRSWEDQWRMRAGAHVVDTALTAARELGRKHRKYIDQLAAEGRLEELDKDSGYLVEDCDIRELLDVDKEMEPLEEMVCERYIDESHAYSDGPDNPLRTFSRVWRRTRGKQGAQRHEEAGPVDGDAAFRGTSSSK